MKPISKDLGMVLISVVAAIAMLLGALLLKGTEFENAWLYILVLWGLAFAAFEIFYKKKDKDKS